MTVNALDPAVDFAALVRLASDIARRPDLPDLLPATPGERTWTALQTPTGWDAWLIAWPEGTDTGWHDHQGSAGVFAVAEGTLTEFSIATAKSLPDPVSTPGDVAAHWTDVRRRYISAGESRRFGARHIHHVVNEGPTTAYSVHVYAPVLRGMSRYQWQDDHLLFTGLDVAGTWQG